MGAPTNKVTLQKMDFYIQRAPTDQGALQTRGHHRQVVHTDKGPLQQRTPIATPTDAVQFLQTRGSYMIYRQGRK